MNTRTIAAATVAMVRREAAILLPWIVCFVGCASVGLVDDMWLDDRPPTALLGFEKHGVDRAGNWCVLFLICSLVGTFDVRHGTRMFLDTLPVSPRARFAWRAITCAGAVFVVAAIDQVATAWQLLRHADRAADVVITGPLLAVGLTVVTTGVRHLSAVALGLLLAPLRQVTWLLSFLLLIAFVTSADRRPAWQSLLPDFNGVPFEIGGGVVVEWDGPVVSLLVAAISLLLGALFAGRGRQAPVAHSPKLAKLAVVGVLAFGALIWWTAWDRIDEPPERIESRRVVFTVPQGTTLTAGELATIDDDVATIEARLGHTLPAVLRADATGELEHAHGKAHGLAIAFTRRAVHDRFAVAHEVTHAVSSSIIGHDHPGLEIFSEGLGNHVARRLATTTMPEHADPTGRLVALAHEGRLADDMVWDAAAAREAGGAALVYAIGEVFVDAMVDLYGDDAPGRVLQALAQTPKQGLAGEALWHDVLARAGMMLEPIRARFFARVNAALKAAHLPDLPEPPIVVVTIDGDTLLVVGVDRQGRPLEKVSCVVRNHRFEDDGQEQRRCRVRLSSLAGPTAEVRVSLGVNVHSRWTRVRLPPR